MKPEKIEIMPFGLSASFYANYEKQDYKIKEIFVALAGPLTSLALIFFSQYVKLPYITIEEAGYANLLILIFNMLPIYPLDGGRIVKGILHIKFGSIKSETLTDKISYITMIVLTVVSSICVYYYKNIAIFLICIFLWKNSLRHTE